MKIKTCWVAGLEPAKASEMKANVLASEVALKKLKEILAKRLELCYNDQRSKDNYADPNWALKQADYIGCQRTYKEIMDIITVTE